MQTIKKRGAKGTAVCLGLVLLAGGCAPPGPRALSRGVKLLQSGKPQKAVEVLRSAVGLLGGTNAQAFNYLGLACQEAGLEPDAARAYQKAIALNPDLSEAHYNLGCLWLEQGRYEEAKNELTTFTLRRDSEAEGWLKLGTVQWRLSEAGPAHQRAAQLNAAERDYSQGLQRSPNNPEGLTGLGLVRLRHGQAQEAARFFERALQVQPGYAPALLDLAIVAQQHLGDRRLAMEKYREYLALDPPAENRSQVQALLDRLGEESELSSPQAARDSEVRSASGTPISTAKQRTADSSRKSPSSRQAIPRYQYLSPAKPKQGAHAQAEPLFAQGQTAQREQRSTDAVAAYRRAVFLDPSFFEAYYNLALVAAQSGDLQLALRSYEYALAIRPESEEARYNFALLLQQGGYWLDAAKELETILAANSKDVRGQLALANLYAQQLQEPGKAKEHYQRVLQLDPNNPQAKAIRMWLSADSH